MSGHVFIVPGDIRRLACDAWLIHGLPCEQVLSPKWEPLCRLKNAYALHPEIEEVTAGSFRQKHTPEIVGTDTPSTAWRPPCGRSTTPRTSGRLCCGP